MNWYIAKLIFRIVCGDGNHQAQFDEQLRLISAVNEDQAQEKARDIIQQEQIDFLNSHQQTVKWEFINITDLYKVDELKDGAELYYNIVEVDDADAYIESSNQKTVLIEAHHQKNSFTEPFK